MKSIYGKLILGFLVSILFSFSVAGYFSIRKNSEELGRVIVEELESSSDLIADFIESVDEEDISLILSNYSESSDVSFSVQNEDNRKIYGSVDENPLTKEDKHILLEHPGEIRTFKDSSVRKFAKSYTYKGMNYIIFVQKDVGQREMIFVDSALLAVFCMLVAGSITFLIIADIIVKPITRLNKATKELTKGNYNVRVNYAGNDEIATLNRSFNLMAQQLMKHEEVRQQFISDVSHEFQTPLTAIQGFATILKNETLSDEQRKKYADIILFHSKRLSTLSKNMLQLTILEGEDITLDKSQFSLTEQIQRVIDVQSNEAFKKNIEIEFSAPKNDVLIEADESRLEQVWINLIGNAIKYTHDDGVVTIEIKKFTKSFEVIVEDTGIGMSKEVISHIFERFYREEKARAIEGNGLGLAICKKIVDLHEGTIDVDSRIDGGSRFTVRIPQDKQSYIQEKLNKAKKDN